MWDDHIALTDRKVWHDFSFVDSEGLLARSQSTRHPPRGSSALEEFFQRNNPRSKSLGRDKGRGGWDGACWQFSLGDGGLLLSLSFYLEMQNFPHFLWSLISLIRLRDFAYWWFPISATTKWSLELQGYPWEILVIQKDNRLSLFVRKLFEEGLLQL